MARVLPCGGFPESATCLTLYNPAVISGSQSVDSPLAVSFRVLQPVVQTAASSLPKFNQQRLDRIATPLVRTRKLFFIFKFLLDLCSALLQNAAVFDYRALRRRPGPDL